jgi:hypothetical protein
MRMKLISRSSLVVVAVVIGLLAIGCTSSGSEDTTTTTTAEQVPDLTTEQQDFVDAYTAEGDGDASVALAAAETLCLNLELLQAAGSPPGHSAEAIELVLLEDASTEEMAEFGLILALAPTTLCDEVLRYGESVAYWLGF